jgi:hypothetical protein
MKKIVLIFLFIIGFLSCKDEKSTDEKDQAFTNLLDLKKLPKKVSPSAGATEVLKDWTEYNSLNTAFNAIYNCETDDDLIIVVEDLIEKEKLLSKSEYPEVFDEPDIKSRQKVFRTYVLKIKMNKTFSINPREAVIEMVNAYNAYNNQFSVIINRNIHSKILFDE